jgi:DNA-binding CsgD family transcriptional regulator
MIHLGDSILTICILAIPILHAAQGDRNAPSQLGFILRSLCAFAVTLVFWVVRPTTFDTALGVALLLTLLGLALSFLLMGERGKFSRMAAQAAIDASAGKHEESPAESEVRRQLRKAAITPLTPREYEVAELTVLGVKRKIIADTLNVQSSTVDSHRISVYNKFGVNNRDELLRRMEENQ